MFKQTVSTFAILLGLPGAAAAQTAAAPAAPICAMPEEAVQVDLKPVPGSDLMTVPVEINGTTKQFLLALSNDPTAISQAAVNDLHLAERLKVGDSTQFMQNLGATNGGNTGTVSSLGAPVYDARNGQNSATMRPRVLASSFALGDASGKNFQLVIADDKDLGKSEPYDGLMTGNFLKQ